MTEVEFSYIIEGTEAEIEEYLSPRQIVEYMGYSVRGEKRSEDTELLRVAKYDTEFTLAFREAGNRHEFTQHGTDGPFRKFHGVLLVEDALNVENVEASRVTFTIDYTIGMLFSFVLNYLGKWIVKRDAEHLLKSLASDVAKGRKASSQDAESGNGRQGAEKPESKTVADDETQSPDENRPE
jgi:ribosome-associated toxin RatA of RatAB toxin-antitoxin module